MIKIQPGNQNQLPGSEQGLLVVMDSLFFIHSAVLNTLLQVL